MFYKLIKNNFLSTLGKEKLTNLSILLIEGYLTVKINFNEIINNFAESKARKRNF